MKMLGKTELNFVEVTYFSQWFYVIHSAVLFSPGHTLETTNFWETYLTPFFKPLIYWKEKALNVNFSSIFSLYFFSNTKCLFMCFLPLVNLKFNTLCLSVVSGYSEEAFFPRETSQDSLLSFCLHRGLWTFEIINWSMVNSLYIRIFDAAEA